MVKTSQKYDKWRIKMRVKLTKKLRRTFPDSVRPFLLFPSLIKNIIKHKIKLYFNIPHNLYVNIWKENFVRSKEPLVKCIQNMELKDRMWSFDYPYEEAVNAKRGCGVSVFALASAKQIFQLMSKCPDLCTVREVIMPYRQKNGYARYYIDWDEELDPNFKISDANWQREAKMRIKMMTSCFKKMFTSKKIQARIKPLPSISTRRDAISIHIVFAGVCFDNPDDFREFDKLYYERFPTKWKSNLDKSNHKREVQITKNCLSLLRTMYSRKAHFKEGVFYPVNVENRAFEDFESNLVWSHEKREDILIEM